MEKESLAAVSKMEKGCLVFLTGRGEVAFTHEAPQGILTVDVLWRPSQLPILCSCTAMESYSSMSAQLQGFWQCMHYVL